MSKTEMKKKKKKGKKYYGSYMCTYIYEAERLAD